MFKFATQPQELHETLVDTIELFKISFSRVWYIALILNLVIMAFSVIVLSTFYGNTPTPQENAGQIPNILSTMFSFPQLLMLVITAILNAFFYALVLHQIYVVATQQTATLGQSVQFVLNKIITLFVATLIFTIAYFVGLLIFAVPGIFIYILFIFYMPIILFENSALFDSFKESAKLVWGNWWKTFALFLIPGLLFLILSFLVILMPMPRVLKLIIYLVLYTLFIPFLHSLILTQYNNLKQIHQRKALKPK